MGKTSNPIRIVAGAVGVAADAVTAAAELIAGTRPDALDEVLKGAQKAQKTAQQTAQSAVQRVTGRPTVAEPPEEPLPVAPASVPLHAKMSSLLARALEQSTAEGQDELFHRILDLIVPDEARILSALSDGHRSPLVSVHDLTPAGMLGEALIENACLVGRMANVALPHLTPTYVGHLLSLGLVEVGPEDSDLKDEYQILLAETDVLAATRAGSRGPVPARVVRRTLTLSPLGRALWAASMGGTA